MADEEYLSGMSDISRQLKEIDSSMQDVCSSLRRQNDHVENLTLVLQDIRGELARIVAEMKKANDQVAELRL